MTPNRPRPGSTLIDDQIEAMTRARAIALAYDENFEYTPEAIDNRPALRLSPILS